MDGHGIIFGSPSPVSFEFVVEGSAEVGDYVEVDRDGQPVLAQIQEATYRSNLSPDTALSLEAPDPGPLQATARVIGSPTSGAPRAPFPPGDRVEPARPETIRKGLGLAEEGGFVGHLREKEVPVKLDIDTLVRKQAAVLAKTGAGKSYMVGVLVEELAKARVPVVIIDPHGEHTALRRPNLDAGDHRSMARFDVKPRGYQDRLLEVTPSPDVNPEGRPLRLDGRDLDAEEICELADLSGYAENTVHAVVRELANDLETYTLEDIKARVVSQDNGSWQVVSSLEYLQNLDLFGRDPVTADELVRPGQVTIVNLRGSTPDVQEAVCGRLLGQIFEARKREQIPPAMVVLEEAHAFCPERNLGSALSQGMVRTVASEGRKFGLGMTVVSQRPAKVDKNVLSQANTQIVLRVTNDNDIKAITKSMEGTTPDMEDELQRLPVGSALVASPDLAHPVFVDVRPRESRHGGDGVGVLEAVREAEADGADRGKEAEEEPDPRVPTEPLRARHPRPRRNGG